MSPSGTEANSCNGNAHCAWDKRPEGRLSHQTQKRAAGTGGHATHQGKRVLPPFHQWSWDTPAPL
eukprot:12702105-Heterocapsa_arctica.AAC.1